jgi:FkbM family methyltransferase
MVGDNGEVYAFEPNPDVFYLLEKSIIMNGFKNVYCYDYALSDGAGKATLSVPGNLIGCASIVLTKDDEFADYDVVEKDVDVLALDYLFEPGEINIIKIDAEASEDKIIYGGKNIIEKTDEMCIIMEWHQARYPDPTEIIDYLLGIDFRFYKIGFDGRPEAISREEMLSSDELEMLCLIR